MKLTIVSLIFQGIPEQIAMVLLAFVLAKITLEPLKIAIIGTTLAILSYVIRLYPATFGMHTIFVIMLLFAILIKFTKTSTLNALKVSLSVVLLLIVIESACVTLLMSYFDLTLDSLDENVVVRILVGLPQVFVLFIISIIIIKLRVRRAIR